MKALHQPEELILHRFQSQFIQEHLKVGFLFECRFTYMQTKS